MEFILIRKIIVNCLWKGTLFYIFVLLFAFHCHLRNLLLKETCCFLFSSDYHCLARLAVVCVTVILSKTLNSSGWVVNTPLSYSTENMSTFGNVTGFDFIILNKLANPDVNMLWCLLYFFFFYWFHPHLVYVCCVLLYYSLPKIGPWISCILTVLTTSNLGRSRCLINACWLSDEWMDAQRLI